MNIAALFIQRPVMTMLVMGSILLCGALGYHLLPVSDLPNVDFPTVQVNVNYPGANPDTMAAAIATPLEKELSTIAGIDSMSSSSTPGATQITIQFVLNRNIDAAAQDVQAAITRAARKLPADLPAPPYYRKVNPADQPILWLALRSPNQPMSKLDELGQTMIAPQISMIDGVALVQVNGSQKYAIRIQLDPSAMAYRGIGIDEVADAISRYNVNMPLGNLNGDSKLSIVQSNGQLMKASEYEPLVVAYRGGLPVRVKDIGAAIDSVENNKVAAWYHTEGAPDRAIILTVQRQPGTNTVEVANAIKALLPTLREKLPASVSLEVFRDASLIIEESANDVQMTLVLTLGLVVMVIFLFLRNFSATIIPSLTLPFSIIGTFAIMCLLGYSLDNLSLMALTLAVGFVVDDAIVMLENIVRHMEMGKSRMQAALDGSREIGFTIVSMTLSLAAVFIPVVFMSGIVGRLLREFSITIGIAVLVSGVVSLTLTPMLCSRFLRDPRDARHGLFYRFTEACFQLMLRFYDVTLTQALRHRRVTMLISLAILAGTVWLATISPMGFLPSEDRDQIEIRTEAPQDVSFDKLRAYQLQLMEILSKDPNVDRYMSNIGSGGGGAGSNAGRMFLVLKPRSQRQLSADQVIESLRPKLARIPGMRCYLTNPPPINVGGRSTRALYQLTLQGPDPADLYRYGADLEERLRAMPDLQDVNSDLQLKSPQLHVDVDRDRARTMDVTPQDVQTALNSAYGTRQISTVLAPSDQYQVIIELASKYQTDPSVLSMLYVRSTTGKLVPLKAVTKMYEDVGPLSINHSGQLQSITISFNLSPGVSLGPTMDKLNDITSSGLPSGMSYAFQGTAQAFQSSISSMGVLLALAVVVIYVVLGVLYEDYWHPLTILSALPFAGFGALLTLWAFNTELSLYAFVGIIMLIGLVKKNGIMMVDFAISARRDEGKTAIAAIHQACLVRFRPIMMTTVCALMAGIPIALGLGAGAESRRPLGLAVVGGLLFSQTLTLYVTPVFYVYMEKFRGLLHRGKKSKKATRPAPPELAVTAE